MSCLVRVSFFTLPSPFIVILPLREFHLKTKRIPEDNSSGICIKATKKIFFAFRNKDSNSNGGFYASFALIMECEKLY